MYKYDNNHKFAVGVRTNVDVSVANPTTLVFIDYLARTYAWETPPAGNSSNTDHHDIDDWMKRAEGRLICIYSCPTIKDFNFQEFKKQHPEWYI